MSAIRIEQREVGATLYNASWEDYLSRGQIQDGGLCLGPNRGGGGRGKGKLNPVRWDGSWRIEASICMAMVFWAGRLLCYRRVIDMYAYGMDTFRRTELGSGRVWYELEQVSNLLKLRGHVGEDIPAI